MKTVSLALLAAVTATSLALGASKEEKTKLTKWKITGQLEEACSCNAACPCWFDSKPTRATCGSNQVLFIQKGNYGNVKLDGLAVANYAQSPENQTMMDSFGKWNFSTNYITKKPVPSNVRRWKQLRRPCCLRITARRISKLFTLQSRVKSKAKITSSRSETSPRLPAIWSKVVSAVRRRLPIRRAPIPFTISTRRAKQQR